MKKQIFSIAIMSATFIFSVPFVNFIEAQVPDVPDPVNVQNICFEKEGEKLLPVPCDKYKNKPTSAPTSEDRQKFEKNASRLFNFLSEKIRKVINDLQGGFQNIFDGIRNFMDSIK
ncbi:MAG: hypothetical protein WC878_07775 [Candidatus Paceibacterota bacterium]|jgi:hypothetical protein